MKSSVDLIRKEVLLASAWSRGLTLLLILSAFFGGILIGRVSAPSGAEANRADLVADRVQVARSGPWGQVEYVPISIECPEELLPVHAFETKVTRWVLKGYTADQWFHLLDDLGISGELRDALRSPEVLHVTDGSVEVTPTSRVVLEFPVGARAQLYRLLAGMPENQASLIFVLAKTLDERFATAGVSDATVHLFKAMSCEYGRYLVFSDVAALFEQIPTYEERARFLKALTRQATLLPKLHVTPESDVTALTRYWEKGASTRDVRPMLEAMARVPGGARISLASLLPSGPSARIYTFPQPASPLNGEVVRQDCHWSAFNFFKDPPDNRYGNPQLIVESLREDYLPVLSDPRYGDLVLFFTPDEKLIHSAVYLADDIVYTKNGDTSFHPWMFSKVQDLIDQYSFQVAPEQTLTVKYFRNRNF